MSSKFKHNKKRNTAFLYETLIRQLTKASLAKDQAQRDKIVSILKEFFRPNSVLRRDLKLYQNILNTNVEERRLAEKIFFESRLERSAIDNKALFNEQSDLISKINKEISQDIYSNFVPNYKDLATLQQIFNNPKIEAKKRVLLEEDIIDNMLVEQDESKNNKMHHIDNVVYKTFVSKFNESYGSLSERQKKLLNVYLGSATHDDLEMKIYLDEELGSLKKELQSSDVLEIFPEQKNEILDLIESFSNKKIDIDVLTSVIKIQELIEESKKDD